MESSLKFRLDALSFRPWGFLDLHIDQEALASGQLAISRASGLFADGLALTSPTPTPRRPRNHWRIFWMRIRKHSTISGHPPLIATAA